VQVRESTATDIAFEADADGNGTVTVTLGGAVRLTLDGAR
jgi:hypothetical protein